MADFGGFQVKTPQEVLQELQAQRQAISMIPDRQAADRANIVFQLSNAFGNPELKKARETENAIKRAEQQFETTYKGEPQSLEGQSKRLQMLYDQVKDHDPLAAAQIQTSLAAVDNERFERKRLQANSDRADRNLAINEDRAAREAEEFAGRFDTRDVRYTIDPNNPSGGIKAYDLTNPEHAAELETAEERGLLVMDQEQAYKTMGQQATRKELQAMKNKSSFEKLENGYKAQNQYMTKATKMIKRLAVNPEAALQASNLKRGIFSLGSEALAFIRDEAWTDRDGTKLNERLTENTVSDRIQEMIDADEIKLGAVDRALFESAVLNMGYILARSLDSGGRLSDQDVNMAIKMLTGGSTWFEDGTLSVPADQLISVLYDRGLDIRDGLDARTIDGIFVEDRADRGDEQARLLREYRMLGVENFDEMDSVVRAALPDHQYKRLRLQDDPDYLTDAERRELEFAEERAAGVEAFKASTKSNKVFRADTTTEKAAPAGATIIYGPDGEVDRILDTPAQLNKALQNAEPGQRFRYKNSKGEIEELLNPLDQRSSKGPAKKERGWR